MARVLCQNCNAWVDKRDYKEPNIEALARHQSSCAVTLSETMFRQHPDLNEIESIAHRIEELYGPSRPEGR